MKRSHHAPLEGTHNRQRRPFDGWPDTSQPEQRAGRPIRKARERLAGRQALYDGARMSDAQRRAFRRPGSLKVR